MAYQGKPYAFLNKEKPLHRNVLFAPAFYAY